MKNGNILKSYLIFHIEDLHHVSQSDAGQMESHLLGFLRPMFVERFFWFHSPKKHSSMPFRPASIRHELLPARREPTRPQIGMQSSLPYQTQHHNPSKCLAYSLLFLLRQKKPCQFHIVASLPFPLDVLDII